MKIADGAIRVNSSGQLVLGSALAFAAIALSIHAPERFSRRMLQFAAALMPFSALRVGGIAVSDLMLLLVLPVAMLVPKRTYETGRNISQLMLAASLLIGGGLLGAMASNAPFASGATLARLSVGALVAVLVITRVVATNSDVIALVRAWLIGVCVLAASAAWTVNTFSGRAQGFTTHPNVLASTCAMSIAISIYFVRRPEHLSDRLLGITASALSLFAIGVSGSRTGILMVSVILIAWTVRAAVHGEARALVTGGFVVGVASISILALSSGSGPLALQRVLSNEAELGSVTRANEQRGNLLEQGVDRFIGSPLTGSGYLAGGRPHNIAVDVAGSAGLLGVFGLILLLSFSVRFFAQGFRRDSIPGDLQFSLATLLLAYGVYALFQNSLWGRTIWMALALAALIEDWRMAQASYSESPRPLPPLRPQRVGGATRSKP